MTPVWVRDFLDILAQRQGLANSTCGNSFWYVWDVSLLDNTTSLVTPVRFTGMLGSLCPCEEVAGNQITYIDTVPVAQFNSDYRTL
jgi:hypothetical protein